MGNKDKKSSKKRHRSRSSSKSQDEYKATLSDKIDHRNYEKLLKLKEQRKVEKELLKSTETADEKRLRRLKKKEEKQRKRKAEMGWTEDDLMLTNMENPYGDDHLIDKFVWKKKFEAVGKDHLDEEEMERLHREKMMENKVELEKVRQRRREREKQMEAIEKEREMLQRDKEADYYKAWEKQEDEFHLKQSRLRSDIRIKDGRAKPIDILAKYLTIGDDELSLNINMQTPYSMLNGLTSRDLFDLTADIKVYMELDEGKNQQYWKDLLIIAEDEVSKANASSTYIRDRSSGLNQSVNNDVIDVFKGKTLSQLELLKNQISEKLQMGSEFIDTSYWESLKTKLKTHMAKKRLDDKHEELMNTHLMKLKEEQGFHSSPNINVANESDVSNTPPLNDVAGLSDDIHSEMKPNEYEDNNDDEYFMSEYENFKFSPVLLHHKDLVPQTYVIDELEDNKNLLLARRRLQNVGSVLSDSEQEFEKKAREGMDKDEAVFGVEIDLGKQSVSWNDKYRPRKPRFFNRVHTGFEWNKYNQTHYDLDNPPPKVVQGYKFNIFYPDLIDKLQPPTYSVITIPGEKDFCILRFSAGPPYEDIAFKIVNRDWETSFKRGFRCQFVNNIFQCWFHFKKMRYRR